MGCKAPKDLAIGSLHKTHNNGTLKIIEWNGSNSVFIEFIDTGYKSIVQSSDIRRGWVKDLLKPITYGVGFMGGLKFSSRSHRKAYDAWSNMLERCYSEQSRSKYPTYSDVTVCEEWHNFQVFCEWYSANSKPNCHMDKDVKVKGNRLYSPDRCLFISHTENNIAAKAKHYRMINPLGDYVEIYNMTKFCRENNLNQSAMNRVSRGVKPQYKGWTLNG